VSTKSKTIDNLGVDLSVRYAQNEELYDRSLIEESKLIPKFAEISVISPYVSSEIDELFDYANKHNSWAGFSPPPNFIFAKKNLFSFNVIPSLGPIELQEEKMEKIKQKKQKKKKSNKEKLLMEEKEDDENDILIFFFEALEKLNNELSSVNAKRGQYHKG
jgi:hypothetical protein